MSAQDPAFEPASSLSIFDGYVPTQGAYDELIDSTGAMREHWRPLVAGWNRLGAAELDRRLKEARRLLRENGITFTAHDDPRDARPWDVDMFPLVLPSHEWHQLVAGVAQRAQLLNAIIGDIYAKGRLLSQRALPAELVYANPGFLRPCVGYRVPNDCFLHLYAADLVRMPDGQWRVVADRTNAPLGLGYALETRVVFARMFPGMIRECRIERLAPFFITLQQTLKELAPHHRDNPRVVLLSEGANSRQHFEDAYLVRYLNYTLAEVGDLAVRNDRVLLKTLGGLLPVDVVLRRLSDGLCDPLEFQGRATRGIPGLLQAVRAGTVAVANALGSSVAETPALLPFLPDLCRRVLRQELLLPSIETWWSGTPDGRERILSRADAVSLQPAFAGQSAETLPAETGAGSVPGPLQAILAQDAYALVGQVQPDRSSAPVRNLQAVCPAPISLRVFAVWSASGYQVMSGGLARVVLNQPLLDAAIATGEASKDAWIVADAEVPELSLLQLPGEPARLRRGGAELPSRVADNMFWLGRYVERAESAARMMRSLFVRLADESEMSAAPELTPLVRTLVHEGCLQRDLLTDDGFRLRADMEGVLAAGILSQFRQRADGFFATLNAITRTADLVRDRLSLESWKILNRLSGEFQVGTYGGVNLLGDLLVMFGQTIAGLAAFSGMAAESMTRSQGWHFMDLGRRLERSLHTIALVQNFLACGAGELASLQEALLEVGESLMTYRSRYLANLRLALVLDLLLTDETNPRSVAFQLAAMDEHVSHLPHDRSEALLGAERRLALNMLNAVRQVDVEVLEEERRQGERNRLDRLLTRLAEQLPRLSDLVSHKYFVHAGSPRQLAEWRLDARP